MAHEREQFTSEIVESPTRKWWRVPLGVLGVGTLLVLSAVWIGSCHTKRVNAKGTAIKNVVHADFPLCHDARNIYFPPGKEVQRVSLTMRKECWSGEFSIPPYWDTWSYYNTGTTGMWFRFSDNEVVYLPPKVNVTFPGKKPVFQVSGDGTLFITVRKFGEFKTPEDMPSEPETPSEPRKTEERRATLETVKEATIAGKVTEVNYWEKRLILQTEDKTQTFHVAHFIPVYYREKMYSLRNLEAGDEIRLHFDERSLLFIDVLKDSTDDTVPKTETPTQVGVFSFSQIQAYGPLLPPKRLCTRKGMLVATSASTMAITA